MKTQIKLTHFFVLICTIIFLGSCRSELDEETEGTENQSLKVNSNIANLILKTTLNDGSSDNFLDGSSCFNVKLPVIVSIDGTEITVDTQNDFEKIQEIFDDQGDDQEELDFIFPITIILNDFSEVIVENEDILEELIENCEDEDEDDNIECIDFQYPFSVSVFNTISELITTSSFNTDKELYNFISDLDIEDIVNVNFPVTVILYDDSEIIINSLEDLEVIIEDSIDDCDENDITEGSFIEFIISGSLEVQKYKDNESNETKNYEDYVFDFAIDGTVSVTLENNIVEVVNGTWVIDTRIDGGLDFILDLGNEAPLNKLNNVWNVKQIQDKRLMLDDRNDEGISKDELFFDQK